MSSLEIIALIFVAFSLIKMIVITIKPKAWYGSANPLMRLINHKLGAIIFFLIIAALIFRYLLLELSIVQIFVAIFLAFVLLISILAPDLKKIIKAIMDESETAKHFYSKYWLAFLIWLVLMVWVVWEIFV